jgi:hypothetical protein
MEMTHTVKIAASKAGSIGTKYCEKRETIPSYAKLSIDQEADMLGRRLGLKPKACKKWMQEQKISSILELKTLWPELTQTECMGKAQDEIEKFILFKC